MSHFNWKYLVGCLEALVLGFAVQSAHATDVTIGPLTGTSFGQSYNYTPDTVIDDVFTFSLSTQSFFDGVVSQVSIPGSFGIADLTLTLLNDTSGTTSTFLPVPDNESGTIQTGVEDLAAGNYTATVTGTVDGSLGGRYALLTAAAPVPEPAGWLLLLVGGIAVVCSRRWAFWRGGFSGGSSFA